MKTGVVGSGDDCISFANTLQGGGHDVVMFLRADVRSDIKIHADILRVNSSEDLALAMESKRVIWLIEKDEARKTIVQELARFLSVSDIVIDAVPSVYNYTMRRYEELQALQIDLLDASFIRNPKSNDTKPVLVVGGNKFAFNYCAPMFANLVGEEKYLYGGTGGAGHFADTIYHAIIDGLVTSRIAAAEMMHLTGALIYAEKILEHLEKNNFLPQFDY